jgi:hypothetical protein
VVVTEVLYLHYLDIQSGCLLIPNKASLEWTPLLIQRSTATFPHSVPEVPNNFRTVILHQKEARLETQEKDLK